MPQPTISQVHVDAILTNISVAYMQREENFIADKVFPLVPVDKRSNKFFTYTKNDWFRDEAQRRAPGTESAGGGFNLSTDTYSCDVFAFHKDVDDQTMMNADAPLSPLREASEFITRRLMLRREVQFVSDFLTTGVWATDVAGVSSSPSSGQFYQWSDYTNSDPIEDIEAGKSTILSTTGMAPNTLVLGYDAFRKLRNHPDIVDRFKYTSSNVITEELMAPLFGVDRIHVAKSVKATNAEGQTGAYAFTVGKIACLMHVAPNPGLLTPSAGYIFGWTGVSGGLGSTIGTSSFRMESLKSTRVEAEVAFDNKVVASDLGYFFNTCVA
jgi:hypothetical protein